jgi:putative DNA methylase
VTEAQPRKKLIEVALPLDEINAACKADKDRKTGTIRNLHKWFAPMPLPAWRALLFAALIDDPDDDDKRAYLLDLIKRLVVNGADLPDASTVDEARSLLARHYPDGLPLVIDPFCGGGSTLVEAQRLGLPSFGSDLNPVPTLITRTLTQMLPQLHGEQPLHGDDVQSAVRASAKTTQTPVSHVLFEASKPRRRVYQGFDGLKRDVLYYAQKIDEQAWRELAQHFPIADGETPVAYLWAHAATCPNPTCGVSTILATSWWLSKKKGDLAWIDPVVVDGTVDLRVVAGKASGEAPPGPKTGRGSSFACVACGGLLDEDYLSAEGKAGRLHRRLVAVASEVGGKRRYRQPTQDEVAAAEAVKHPDEFPTLPLPDIARWFSGPRFGLTEQADLYTPRQLIVLTTLARLVRQVRRTVLDDGGSEPWADAVTTLLGLSVGRVASYGSMQARWRQRTAANAKAESVFSRADMPLLWDFAETFFRSNSVGDWLQTCASVVSSLSYTDSDASGVVTRADARTTRPSVPGLVATDPPYFDAIGYADLSDYFYVWHRQALRDVHPDLYTTIAAPRTGELTAVPEHHGRSRDAARDYFIAGFTETFRNLQSALAPGLPMLVVYASKEQKAGREEETRWSSILTAMVQADLEITGTWPIHGTGSSRMIGLGTNSVATYVVMVCRPRAAAAGTCSLSDLNRALRRELRPAVHAFQAAGILPVDLAQAAIGPGMQVYSRYRQVLDQAGKPVGVEQALRLINAALGEVLDEQEGELDPHSRFAVSWWERNGWTAASFGEADQLARPHGISVDDLLRAGVAAYPTPGYVSLLGSAALDRTWRPADDSRPTAWEAVHHLADRLIDGGGATEAGRLMGELGSLRDPAQGLVYRLHDIAAKKGRTKDQERYNALIASWSDLLAVSATEKDGLF